MKNLKNYAMALVALVIATSSITLMSFKSTTNSQEFGKVVDENNQSSWVRITEEMLEGRDYECNPSSNDCTGLFEDNQIDPITNQPYPGEEPASTKHGDFELLAL